MKRILCLLLMLVFLICTSTYAVDYYIAPSTSTPSGNDSNSGTIGSPWLTLTKCLTVIAAGDTIYCRGGTYNNQSVTWNFDGEIGTPITIKAYPGEYPVFIKGTASTIFFLVNYYAYEVGDLVIDGLEMRNYTSSGITIRTGENITVRNCRFLNMGAYEHGALAIGGVGSVYGDLLIENCYFENIGRLTPSSSGLDHAIYTGGHGGTNVNQVIRNCYFVDCKGGYAIQGQSSTNSTKIYNNVFYLYRGTDRTGIWITGGNQPGKFDIYNNTFVCDPSGATYSWFMRNYYYTGTAANLRIMNNVAYYTSSVSDVINTGTTKPTFSNNLYYNGTESDDIVNKLSSDPLFVNIAAQDFSLQSGSPAKDSGTTSLYPATDKNGTARPYNTIPDRGAYEYVIIGASPSVGADNTVYAPGATITVTVDNGNSNTQEWVALYISSNPDSTYSYLENWQYLNGTKTEPGSPVAYPAVVTFTAPTVGNTYNIRYFANNGYLTKLATSDDFVVTSVSNSAPIVIDDSGITTGATPVVIDLSDNVTDVDGAGDIDWSTLDLVPGNPPSYGALLWDRELKNVTYTAKDWATVWYGGTDSFRYFVEDMAGTSSNEALITITINSMQATSPGYGNSGTSWKGGWK